MLILMGLQFSIFGLFADAVAANRRLTEELWYRVGSGRRIDSAIVPSLEELLGPTSEKQQHEEAVLRVKASNTMHARAS